MANKNILLIEPGYKNKYPPLGLMKIAQYHGKNGKGDNIKFIKGEDNSVFNITWDRIYITTLFSFEWKKISQSLDFAIKASNQQPNKIFVGGIAASLMHKGFMSEAKWRGVRFIKGLLTESPAISLELDGFAEELYADDVNGNPIEDLIPDYSILDQINYKYPLSDAYFVYASRGCVRKCQFCGVPDLEGDQRDTLSLTKVVRGIENLYGAKKDLTLMDNNIVASPRFKEIIEEIRDLGFEKGATLKRGKNHVQRRVDFNQGVDARILCKTPMFLKEISTICIKPLRIAFDHFGLRKPYEMAIQYAHDSGLKDLSNYMLYNFHDNPDDLYERMSLNINLNEKLGIRIFSFPMRYQPTDRKDRSYVGEKWNKYFLRSIQLILQATHGIVSGNPEFFRRAFGANAEQFKALLLRPHHYIFNRVWYEESDGKPEYEEYIAAMDRLSNLEKLELMKILCSTESSKYETSISKVSSGNIRRALRFYKPISDEALKNIFDVQRAKRDQKMEEDFSIPDDERVEDVDLELVK